MLSDAELGTMRTEVDRSLPGTAIIQTSSYVSDGGGGGTTSWSASGTAACRLSPVSGTEGETADLISAEAEWIATLPALTPITTDSRLVTGGVTFNVEAVRAPRSYEISRRVELVEVKA